MIDNNEQLTMEELLFNMNKIKLVRYARYLSRRSVRHFCDEVWRQSDAEDDTEWRADHSAATFRLGLRFGSCLNL